MVAIDPGASGGIAYTDNEGIVQAENMPDGMTAIGDRIRNLAVELHYPITIIEQVGMHRMGNNASASVKFSRHCGHIEMACYMCSLPTEQVAPGVWMKYIHQFPKGTEKKDRKNYFKDEMQRRYPHLKVTLKTADALGILTWASR